MRRSDSAPTPCPRHVLAPIPASMQSLPHYVSPFREPPGTNSWCESTWNEAAAAYQEGRYHDALGTFLRMLDPERVPDGSLVGRTLELEHGSVRLRITVTEDAFSIEAPFLEIPDGGRAIAMMRKVMNLTNDLAMSRFQSRNGDQIYIVHRDGIEGVHPSKLRMVLGSICVTADNYDDLFEEKFGAKRIEPLEVETWEGETLERAHAALAKIVEEGLAFCQHFETKQNLGFAYRSLVLTLERITWTLWPQGILRARIVDLRRMLNDGSKSGAQRIELGKAALRTIAGEPAAALGASCYEARFILSQQHDTDFARYQSILEGPIAHMQQMREARDYDFACLMGMHSIYEDFVDHQLPEAARRIYVEALETAGGMGLAEASAVLLQAIRSVESLELTTSTEPDETASLMHQVQGRMRDLRNAVTERLRS